MRKPDSYTWERSTQTQLFELCISLTLKSY